MAGQKVLLINPNQMKPAVIPIALDYLSSSLTRKGFVVDILDLCFSDDFRRSIDEYFEGGYVDAVGISIRNIDDCYFLSQDFMIPKIKEIINHIRTRTDSPLILGGVGFSTMPEKILEYCGVGLGIWGDGEWALPILLERIEHQDDFSHIPGLVYKTGRGYRRNPPGFPDLDDLPLSSRKAVDNVRYFEEGGMGAIETKRGCGQSCIYCADPLSKGRGYRLRSPRLVVDEMEVLLRKGINYLHLCDSEFNLPYGHAIEICKEMISRGIGEKVYWYAYMSPAPFSEELASLMVKAGCMGVDFGVDHGNDVMLKRLGRSFTKEDIVNTAKVCHQHGIAFMYDLLLGGPGETQDTVRETIDLMKDINPSRVGVSTGIRIYPNTHLSKIVLREGVSENNEALYGAVVGNDGFFKPIFYISSGVGEDLVPYVAGLVRQDERFFLGTKEDVGDNYNYSDNSILVEAIRSGHRGAFWDILRKIKAA